MLPDKGQARVRELYVLICHYQYHDITLEIARSRFRYYIKKGKIKMHKIYIMFILLICLVICGCSSGNNDKKISTLVNHFKSSGLSIGTISPKHYQMVMASEGAGIEINGREIEIYKYDINKPEQKMNLDKIKKENKVEFMGLVIPAKINGSFVMLNYHDHPNQSVVIDAFMKFGGQ